MAERTVLITGGAGFIARATIPLLLQSGWRVLSLDTLDPQVHGETAPDLPPEVEFHRGDVLDQHMLAPLVREADAVLHLAARTGVGQSMYAVLDYAQTNVSGTAALLELLAAGGHQVQRLVVASSRAIYGEGAYCCPQCGPVTAAVRGRIQLEAGDWEVHCPRCRAGAAAEPTGEDKALAPGSVYAITKRDQEEMCLCIGAAYGIEAVALRYFNVYGPGQPPSNPYTGVIPAFASRVLSGRAAEVYEDGAPLRDFVHVEDVARANVLALERDGVAGLAVNIGSGEPISILEAAAAVTSALRGSDPPRISGRYRVGDIRHCYADLTRARQQLGYAPRVPFRAGVARMAPWLQEQFRGDFSEQAALELATRGLSGKGTGR